MLVRYLSSELFIVLTTAVGMVFVNNIYYREMDSLEMEFQRFKEKLKLLENNNN